MPIILSNFLKYLTRVWNVLERQEVTLEASVQMRIANCAWGHNIHWRLNTYAPFDPAIPNLVINLWGIEQVYKETYIRVFIVALLVVIKKWETNHVHQ